MQKYSKFLIYSNFLIVLFILILHLKGYSTFTTPPELDSWVLPFSKVFIYTMEVNETRNCLVTDILLNI